MKEIPLSNSPLKVFVDDEDFDNLKQWTWRLDNKGEYARRTTTVNGKIKEIRMHVYLAMPPEGYQVDHKDRNKLNNCKGNLRTATRNLNCVNQVRSRSLNNYRGVCKTKKGFQVYVGTKYIGLFANDLDAAMAYDKAAVAIQGEFAVLNFKPELA